MEILKLITNRRISLGRLSQGGLFSISGVASFALRVKFLELKIFACQKKRTEKKGFSKPHVIKDIKISRPWHHSLVDFGPMPSSSKRLQSIARRDGLRASMDMDQVDTKLKTKI